MINNNNFVFVGDQGAPCTIPLATDIAVLPCLPGIKKAQALSVHIKHCRSILSAGAFCILQKSVLAGVSIINFSVQGCSKVSQLAQATTTLALEALDLSMQLPFYLFLGGIFILCATIKKIVDLPPSHLLHCTAKAHCTTMRISRRTLYALQSLIPFSPRTKAFGLIIPSAVNTLASRVIYTPICLKHWLHPKCPALQEAHTLFTAELKTTHRVTRGLWLEIYPPSPSIEDYAPKRSYPSLSTIASSAGTHYATISSKISLWNQLRIAQCAIFYSLLSLDMQLNCALVISILMLVQHISSDWIEQLIDTLDHYRAPFIYKMQHTSTIGERTALMCLLLLSESITLCLFLWMHIKIQLQNYTSSRDYDANAPAIYNALYAQIKDLCHFITQSIGTSVRRLPQTLYTMSIPIQNKITHGTNQSYKKIQCTGSYYIHRTALHLAQIPQFVAKGAQILLKQTITINLGHKNIRILPTARALQYSLSTRSLCKPCTNNRLRVRLPKNHAPLYTTQKALDIARRTAPPKIPAKHKTFYYHIKALIRFIAQMIIYLMLRISYSLRRAFLFPI